MRRLLLFALLSVVVCALLNPGNFGTIDTARRLQVARWLRLGEPPVLPHDPALIGRNGTRQAWYGIGQSLVLEPFDALVSAMVIPHLARFGLDAEKQQQAVALLIAFLMQSFLTVGLVALAYEVLRAFEFTPFLSMAGALTVLFGTTCLQYVQCAQENNLLLLLALGALYSILRWQQHGGGRWPALAGMACGFAILVRLPSVLETAVLLLFAMTVGAKRKRFVAAYVPPIVAALLLDRWYHWYRFGELFGTYAGVLGRQYRPAGAPASFPFSFPFWKGFLGTLFSPDKSVFLFDPLLVVLLLVVAWKWREIPVRVRVAIPWLAVLLLLYAATYATYYDFGGDVAWAHRFVTLPVQLLCLFAAPLFLKFGEALPRFARRMAWAIIIASFVLQAASTTIAPNVEIIQRERGDDHGVIVNRAINLTAVALHRTGSDRFTGVPMEWRTLSYLPFQLRFRFPSLAAWAMAIWVLMLAALPVLVGAALQSARKPSQLVGR